jgi:hypothetical protein
MRVPICFLFSLIACKAIPQSNYTPTDKFTIEGRVKYMLTFSTSDIDTFKTISLPDLLITDHMGSKRQTLTHLKGVLLKDVLVKAELDAENPKVLSEYYYVLEAPDNYKIVYSWNEIFNTETGNNIYILVEEDGKNYKQTDERIAIVTMTDLRTGRRHMRNISRIIVGRAN